MIVPLQIRIEKVTRPEDFDVDTPSRITLKGDPNPPVYRLLAAVLDTEAGEVRVYDFHSMSETRRLDPDRVGLVTLSDVEENREFLTNLRDEIDRVLS